MNAKRIAIGAAVLGILAGASLTTTAATSANTRCVCVETRIPAWAGWSASHRMMRCSVAVPRAASSGAVTCTAQGLDAAPVGITLQVAP